VRILGLQASPNVDGLTASAAKAVLRGAGIESADTELVHIRLLALSACRACEDGWGTCRTDNQCIADDDLRLTRGQMGEAEGLVIATPVYFGEVAEIMKSMFDRLRRCEWGLGDASPLHATPVIAVAAAGGSGGGAVSALAMLERYIQGMGLVTFDVVTVTQRSRAHKLPMLEEAGSNLARAFAGNV